MRIIDKKINKKELKFIAENTFGDMVKAVVDVDKNILCIDAELHSDIEAFLLENGSKQNYKAIPVLIEKFSMRKVNVSVDGIIS